MKGSKFLKLLGLAATVVIGNVIAFSSGFAGIEIGSGAFETALGVTLLLGSGLALLYGTYTLYIQPRPALSVKQIQSHEDYIEALTSFRRMKALKSDVELAIEQLERMRKKKAMLLHVLGQRFDLQELSYIKFASVVQEVEKLLYVNVRGMLNRLPVFDESEFERVQRQAASGPRQSTPAFLHEKVKLYNELLAYIRNALGTNEEILLKLDQLMLEISRLDALEPEQIESMPCMQEIDALIKQTKLYKV